MTQVHIDTEKKICVMTFAGTGADLAADIGLIMGAVYQALKQDSPLLAVGFKRHIQAMAASGSLVWSIDAPTKGLVIRVPKTGGSENGDRPNVGEK